MKKTSLIISLILIGFGLYFYNANFLFGKELSNKETFRPKYKNDTLRSNKPVRISYAHGDRTHLLWRAYINKYFDDEGVNIELYSEYSEKRGFYKVPKSYEDMEIHLPKDGQLDESGDTSGGTCL